MRRSLVLVLGVLTAIAAGCGGGDSGGAISTTEWADNLCSAITTWTDSVRSAGNELQGGNLSKDTLSTSGEKIKTATSDFADDVKSLGRPDTDAGQKAKDSLDSLSEDIKQDADEIGSAIDDVSGASGVTTAVSSVQQTLVKMGSQISSTFSDLQKLDSKGELEDAFKNADSCKSLASASSGS